ncbi:LLM class flavin-dependent oxidoreductase [Corynebacterium liangguodongii]|uniref:Alkanesulfonate monooxygenase n=1 Tax=Corynebacterium liangguodongii TaxID=2079535 RepID=A0A2S0WBD6_9CORY|nr:LLM class flavin-dependent oxidoreductase [Corynebacterium liangguodongii]AWB83078.1 alkanesulfonate monooxygenase [Corynebacterium liangguodongii]PWB99321.1 LLM class flavin-dependent oxidoreductase [Corynebacterium liangguodongii]
MSTTAQHKATLHWFLPTYGDSRTIMPGGHGAGLHTGARDADLNYLTQIALAAERNGFESVLTPTGQWCEDAWLATAALIGATSRLKFLVALRPGLVSPLLLAQQAATFQALSGNRVLLNVVVGGEDHEQRSYGDTLSKPERYARAGEVLDITHHLWNKPEPLDYAGQYTTAENASLAKRPAVSPPIYLGGSSEGAIDIASRHADVFLTWGETPQAAGEKRARVAEAAAERDRELDYGIRFHVIARPTTEEAWAEAGRLLSHISAEDVEKIQRGLAKSQSESQRRMTQLHGQGHDFHSGQDPHELEVYPGLWAGVGLVRGGAGTALVGSYAEVAALIKEYIDEGFGHFILSGYPHLEETFHVGEGVVPELHKLGIEVAHHDSAVAASQHQQVPFAPRTA